MLLVSRSLVRTSSRIVWHHRNLSSGLRLPPSLSAPPTANEIAVVCEWIASFEKASIPREQVDLTFARSSGPGGQNVNKVNTKAMVRCALDKTWIPAWARPALMQSSAYVASSHTLLVTSSQHRGQSENVDDCLTKLHDLICTACLSAVPTLGDPERLARKAAYKRAAKERRKSSKMYRAAIKGGRKSNQGDWH